ncbi:MAG: pantoate--beta-alanine ligase [Phycisphaerae bacterium]|nr:pantoate--beta-alanine ligase [Phycisphaerae bacterium]
MKIVHDTRSLDLDRTQSVGFVPTMGALHDGHSACIEEAASLSEQVVVSIYVNPTQFNQGTDLQTYPRQLEQDIVLARDHGATVAYIPDDREIYPDGIEAAHEQAGSILLPSVACRPQLEDRCRPGHLAGMIQVVDRLFQLVEPTIACFGEKDYQQLLTVKAVFEGSERFPGLRIHPCRTIRQADGLACSSRNKLMDEGERARAVGMARALHVSSYCETVPEAESSMLNTLKEHGLDCEYAVVRDAGTLEEVVPGNPTRSLIAARCGQVRLIDNAPGPPLEDPDTAEHAQEPPRDLG